MVHSLRLSVAFLIAIPLTSKMAAAQAYDFELVNNGAVIANTNDSSSDDTAFPSVVKIPDWVAQADRPDPSANYYMYYGNHSGDAIKMKWASSIGGTWTDYSLPGAITGVFDVGPNNDPTRDNYAHISAPDVVVDDVNQQFIMYFHGDRQAGGGVSRVHERFVSTSGSGLNFNDAVSGNGESGYGPVEITSGGVERDVWIGDDYMKTFQKDGRWYGVGKRGVINAAPATGGIWTPPAGDPFDEAWDREDTMEPNWSSLTSGMQDNYYSPGATFLASQEFEDHPNNPVDNRRIFSNGNAERMNHVDVNLLPGDLLEVLFTVREASKSDPDDYTAVNRIVYDVSDPDFQNWTVARDESGTVMFDVVLKPEDVVAAVESAVGTDYDPSLYADPFEFGDTEIFFDDDGSKYLFFSYVSNEFGGAQGEGAISAVRLISTVPGDFDADGDVDIDDVDMLSTNIGLPASARSEMDLNGDGSITLADHDQHIETLLADENGIGALIGDLNLDGDVDVSEFDPVTFTNVGDASILLSNLGQTSGQSYTDGDLNGDGDVDISQFDPSTFTNVGDASRLLASLGSTTAGASPASSAVPEPGSAAALFICGIVATTRRRK